MGATMFVSPLFLSTVVAESKEKNNGFHCGIQGLKITQGGGTGSVDPRHMKDFQINCGLIGHSDERRSGMTLETMLQTLDCVPDNVTVLICVGETDPSLKAMDIFYREVEKIASKIVTKNFVTYVTYEPQWLISTNKDEQSLISHADAVRHCTATILKIKEITSTNRILYGGSVSEFSPQELHQFDVEGFLIGSLSTKPVELGKFINSLI